MKAIMSVCFCACLIAAKAQTDSSKSQLTITGYLETYYCYDFSNPPDHSRADFIYSHNRHNEVNLNLGFIKAAYERKMLRANLAIMTGTYTNANMSAEPGVLKNIFEANTGLKLSKTKNVWLDMGIFASHIGFESAIGKDCGNLTRSILADNSPYFESGIKISRTSAGGKWFMSALLLNGWQRIQRPDGNNTPAFGHQVTYKPNDNITLNSSSFVGNVKPDSAKQMRYFHNFYGIFQLHKKFGITLGFDMGAEQSKPGSSDYNLWYSPVLIARYALTSKTTLGIRGEYYADPNQVIISTGTANGFETFGFSINLDHMLSENMMWRLEARELSSRDAIFSLDNKAVNDNYFLTTSLAISF